jgi:hypothetical protein
MKDFDVLAPPRRVAKIGGEEIDVSLMSARVALEFVKFSGKYNFNSAKGLKTDDFKPEMLEDMIRIIAMICKKSSEKITADWLLDNIELPTLIEFMRFVFEPMTSRMKSLDIGGSGEGQGDGEPAKN